MEWIEIKEDKDLPPTGKYVFARHNRGTWHDREDQQNVNCVVVKLVKGISEAKRRALNNNQRAKIYKFGDQEGNNLVAYAWLQFGPDSFFGQSITHWMPIPPLKKIIK